MYVQQFLLAFLAAFGFALVFQSPTKTLLIAALNAGIGWVVYKFFSQITGSIYIGTFASAFFISIISDFCAKIFKFPAIIFIVPGVINLCPGEAVYNAMKFFIENQTDMVLASFYKAMAIAGAIAFGILLSSSFSTSLRSFRSRKVKRTDFTRSKKWKK